MKVLLIQIVISALDTVTKWLIKGRAELEIRAWVETIQTTVLLRGWLDYWEEFWRPEENCCHSDSSEIPSANAGVESFQRSKIIIIMVKNASSWNKIENEKLFSQFCKKRIMKNIEIISKNIAMFFWFFFITVVFSIHFFSFERNCAILMYKYSEKKWKGALKFYFLFSKRRWPIKKKIPKYMLFFAFFLQFSILGN